MFLFVPYRSDAPVYHFPWATIGMILLCTIVFVAQVNTERVEQLDPYEVEFDADEISDEADFEVLLDGSATYRRTWIDACALDWGDGWKPHQWLTSLFLHGGLIHLLGNMVFLWTFGIIVEGKVGWSRFLGLYLLIGVASNAIEQTISLALDGHGASVGASGAIFGLVAVSLVWAPLNEVDVFYLIGVRPGTLSVTVRLLGALFGLSELGYALLDLAGSQGVGSAALHLLGFGVGFPLGVLFLRRDWVDCEGWDLFSIRAGLGKPTKRIEGFEDVDEIPDFTEEHRAQMVAGLRSCLADGDVRSVNELRGEFTRRFGIDAMPNDVLFSTIQLLVREKGLADSGDLLEEAHRRKPESASFALPLAQFLVEVAKRPASALDVLDALPHDNTLTGRQEEHRTRLAAQARELIDGGALELDD